MAGALRTDSPAHGGNARILLALGVSLGVYLLLVRRYDFLCDDALISFRYARNLALGQGLNFNPGADPPIESYSNLLWVLLLAPFELLGRVSPVVSRVISVACGVALLIAVARLARRSFGLGAGGTFAVALFFATLPPLVVWSTGGLETMAMALLLFLTFERLVARPARGWQAALCALAASLMRVDGAIWVSLVLLGVGLVWWLEDRPDDLRRALLRVAGVLCVGLLLHVAFRVVYYEDAIPNVVRLRGGIATQRVLRGVNYVLMALIVIPSITLVLLSSLRRWPASSVRILAPAWCVIGGGAAYIALIGGDFLPMWRYLVPAMPFVVLVLASAWVPTPAHCPRMGAVLSVACIALSFATLFDLLPITNAHRARLPFRDQDIRSEQLHCKYAGRLAERTSALGRALAFHTQPGESLVVGALGGIGYYSDLFLYDVYGLVTPWVAAQPASQAKGMAGHDKKVPVTSFLPFRPTYLKALLVAGDAPPLRAPVRFEGHRLSEIARVEDHPVPPDLGGYEGWILRLVRVIEPDEGVGRAGPMENP